MKSLFNVYIQCTNQNDNDMMVCKQECNLKDSYNPPPQVDSHLCVTFCCRRNGITEGLVLHYRHTQIHGKTFDHSSMKFFSKVPEIWNRQEIQGVP